MFFHTDLRTPLILSVQSGQDLANLSPRPTHLLSITPQTNWSVTPLSGPRLHFSSHPSPPKHSFFFAVTFSAPSIHTFTLPSTVRHLLFLHVCSPAPLLNCPVKIESHCSFTYFHTYLCTHTQTHHISRNKTHTYGYG